MYDNIWLKRVWIPFWVIQLLFSIILLASIGLGFGLLRDNRDDISDDLSDAGYDSSDVNHAWSAVSAILAVWIAVCAVTIIFDIVEIFLLARKRLSPVVAVVLNSLTTLVWLVLIIIACIGAVNSGTGLGIIWLAVIFATCLGKLIYCSVVLHRFRKTRSRGAYTPAQAESGLDPGYTAYNPAGPPPNPFRDPSRDPSPAPTPNQGAATEYYGGAPAFEMQQQQPQQRYYS
ncbi:hypothetical protein M409DRAFT_20887 [Zasmidium cellare ATCC 36951]|uniref:MARVEL domain-containing protein n=1 Tax=Zasmidium cellare ATCC 36951 TaxID=1080233 RepID=A0A6A6CQB5_ZASCE|nr:uncharacterized protein M409DRAFT_20887 [Zasmidium cellare ATCC 36951]KAF2168873.1 hypothetical protein M409DRAFT_20887 [Zasmidium cellare ATCC 36951]